MSGRNGVSIVLLVAAAKKMRIATWNIERLKHKSDIVLLNSTLAGLKADIFLLTETDNQVNTTN